MTDDEVRELIRFKAAGNVAAWAKSHNMSAQYVSDVLNGRRAPGETILNALRLAKVVTYQPKEGD
jgi:hypothetical protein